MDRPETRYARSGEISIAYQVVGGKPFDLIWVPGWISNVEESWEVPEYAHFLHRLASFSRLILFDKRRDWPGHWPSLEARARIDDVIFYTDKFDAWDRTTDWDRAHESKQEELGNLYKRIEQFRDELLSTLRILDYGQIQPG
jgi:hypothetical protein